MNAALSVHTKEVSGEEICRLPEHAQETIVGGACHLPEYTQETIIDGVYLPEHTQETIIDGVYLPEHTQADADCRSLYHVLRANALSSAQISQILALQKECAVCDGCVSDYPLREAGQTHWLFYAKDSDALQAACTLIPLDEDTVECCALTRPAARRSGCFTRLLAMAETEAGERDILFFAHDMPDTLAVLHAIEARLLSVEYQMEKELSGEPVCAAAGCILRADNQQQSNNADEEAWNLIAPGGTPALIGSCRLSPAGQSCVCLHHVEIQTSMRRKGYGVILIRLLSQQLAAHGIRRILLHVSGDNPAAIALYKKTGFSITETLSCYLY